MAVPAVPSAWCTARLVIYMCKTFRLGHAPPQPRSSQQRKVLRGGLLCGAGTLAAHLHDHGRAVQEGQLPRQHLPQHMQQQDHVSAQTSWLVLQVVVRAYLWVLFPLCLPKQHKHVQLARRM